MLIDTHCHLYVKEFEADIEAVIKRALESGVHKFYLPAIDSSTHHDMIALEERFKGKCIAMIGLHPCSVNENYEKELEIIETLLMQREFAAIGETGLDFYWDTSFKAAQYKALEKQVDLAIQYNLPLVLHTRNALPQTIDVIKNFSQTNLKGIFHCFGGSLNEAEQIISCNFLLGIGGVVTYKNSGLAGVLPHIDIKNIVLETDAPYLSPVPYRGKRNESSYITEVVKKIAEIKGITGKEVIEATTLNAEKLFGKKPL
jgi:TatD DNase family protein